MYRPMYNLVNITELYQSKPVLNFYPYSQWVMNVKMSIMKKPTWKHSDFY